MRVRFWFVGTGQRLFDKANFAIAAIAAGRALVAEMVCARIFRAFHADPRRLFFANAADE
jgi:hypothetical protein